MHGPCRRVASWGLKGSVEPLIFVHKKFVEGAWIIGFRVCVRVAGAVPDTSYHGKQKEVQHLEVFSEHSLQAYPG